MHYCIPTSLAMTPGLHTTKRMIQEHLGALLCPHEYGILSFLSGLACATHTVHSITCRNQSALQIGQLTLFERLPSMIEAGSLSGGSVGTAEGGPATLTHVHLLGNDIARAPCLPSNIEYNRQLDTSSMSQEIEVLQAKLDEMEDKDEQRALEEDVIGKARTVSSCYLFDAQDGPFVNRSCGSVGCGLHLERRKYEDPGLEDDQVHLQHIMLDAGVKTSKYELLLAARGAKQAKWSGTNRGTPAIDNQGPTPSASSQTPPTSVV
ncbi:hypothetical protein EDC04DRAFT_3088657 [Pisolithus marmoratus]|nr:hypothetical protein EDC04DRAFT_3088657 [Pisolithus marmoratus]